MIRISDYLSEDKILFLPGDLPKRDLFFKLIEVLKVKEPDIALRSVLAREQIGSTLLDRGVAVPHARVHGIEKIQAVLGIVARSGSNAVEDIRLCLLFVGPPDDMKGHLEFLAGCAALFQNRDLCDALLRYKDKHKVIQEIRNYEHAKHINVI